MGRKSARDAAMRLLYEHELGGGNGGDTLTMLLSEGRTYEEKQIIYIRDVVAGVQEHLQEIDTQIGENSIGWKNHRIAKVELSVLRVAIYEMLYRQDIPVSVVINEAVELAKRYGGAESSVFVNGILATISKKLPAERLVDI